jgi:CDP-6-deoxy-D-xylo-4-hexulose-3-dehydrase
MSSWKDLVSQAMEESPCPPAFDFPLNQVTLGAEEVVAMTEVLISRKLSMGPVVRQFEDAFAKAVGSPYAVFCNSGSSANLLAVAAAFHGPNALKAGDEALVPVVCWSTSVFPLMQYNLTPVLVDVNPETLNVDISALEAKLTPKTKCLFLVHVMGNCSNMKEVVAFCEKHSLVLIEDTCESLLSHYDGRALGTFGRFGTYSSYFSHHITTGEGGIVTCKTEDDFYLLKSIRAHGWVREYPEARKAEVTAQYPDIDERFLFVRPGYNLRPMEMQAAAGLVQIRRVFEFNEYRKRNYAKLVEAIKAHPKFAGQFRFVRAQDAHTDAAWFGFPCLLSEELAPQRTAFLAYLTSKSVENRPVLTGNFARQPALKGLGLKPEEFVGGETVHRCGFFFGIDCTKDDTRLDYLADVLVSFFAK